MGVISPLAQQGMLYAATTPGGPGGATYDRLQILDSSNKVLAEFSWTFSDWSPDLGDDGTTYSRSLENVPITVTAIASGTAARAKLYASSAEPSRYIDGIEVGLPGSDRPVIISSTSIVQGQPVRLNSLIIKAAKDTIA